MDVNWLTDINNSRHSQNTHQNNYLRCSKPRMPHCNHDCSSSFAFSNGFFSSLQFLLYFPFLVKNKCKKVNLAVIVLIFQTSNEMRNKLWLLMNYKSCNLFTVVSLVNKNAIKNWHISNCCLGSVSMKVRNNVGFKDK